MTAKLREEPLMLRIPRIAAVLSDLLVLAPAASRAETPVVMALPNTSLTFSLAYVALDLGFWPKRGLAVTQPVITGPAAMNAVIAGSAEFSHSTALTFTRAAAKGQKCWRWPTR